MALIDDIRALDDAGWDALWPLLLAESHRRQVLASARAEAERLAADYLDARDRQAATGDGAWPSWVQPTGAHDAYPAGYQVAHAGRVWRSMTAANVWEPGATGVPEGLWEDVTDAPEPAEPTDDTTPGGEGEGGPEPYTPPTPAAHPWEADVPYYTGDLVAWQGVTWRVIQDHDSQADWQPHLVPALYQRT